MAWPTSQDYNEAIQSPETSLADPELRLGQAVTNALGIPMPCSGNFADVYQVRCPSGNTWALKCFTRSVPRLQERYSELSRYLVKAHLPFTVEFQYLAEGILIHGQPYPLLKMRWVDGLLLNRFVRGNIDYPGRLERLREIWVRMIRRFRETQIAHGDLQHGNVILILKGDERALSLRLIDYDGMYVPALAQTPSGERGHPAYQHPQRGHAYGAELDRFPALSIYCALRALELGGQALWTKYDTGDNLLFREADFRRPAESQLFKELWQTPDPMLHDLVGHVFLSTRMSVADTPLLQNVIAGDGSDTVPLAPASEEAIKAALGPCQPIRRNTVSRPVMSPPPLFSHPAAAPKPERPAVTPRTPWGFDQASSPEPKRKEKVRRSGMPLWALVSGTVVATVAVAAILLMVFLGGDNTPSKPAPPAGQLPITVVATETDDPKIDKPPPKAPPPSKVALKEDQGTLIVDLDDPKLEIVVKVKGILVEDKTTKREFTLTASSGEIEVLERDGSKLTTRQFELTRGDTTTVQVARHELADIRAARWVLSIGGNISINENGRRTQIKAVGDLPLGAFELTHVWFGNAKVSDAGLAVFKDCKNLTILTLLGSQVSDTGLAYFKDCKNLTNLTLIGSQVSDAGLAHFKDCKNLKSLSLQNTQVSDAGLAYFKECKNLTNLSLVGAQVSDAGLVVFKDCKNLNSLSLQSTQVSDAGLGYFKDCKNLRVVTLGNTKVGDAGLAHFKDCKNLVQLDLRGTNVSVAGVSELQKALPKCRIQSSILASTEPAVDKIRPIELTIKESQEGYPGELSAADPRYKGKKKHKLFLFPMEAGKTYQIDMKSRAFDSYLFLEDPDAALLTQDDDSGGMLDARITIKATKTGKHRIIATHFDGKLGQFSLTIRHTDAAPPLVGTKASGPEFELQQKISQAIDRGVLNLKKLGAGGAWPNQFDKAGMNSLAAWTLLECGVLASDPIVQKAAVNIRKDSVQVTDTYSQALAILFFDRLGDPGDEALIQALGVRLLAGEANGRWSYENKWGEDDDRAWLEKHIAEAEKQRQAKTAPAAKNNDLFPQIRKQIDKLKPAKNHAIGDNSNTQFAMLALWVARRHGLPVDQCLTRVDAHFRSSHVNGAGWGYSSEPELSPRASMTCAGLLGLALGQGIRADKERQADRLLKEQLVQRGFALLADVVKNTDVFGKPATEAQRRFLGEPEYYYYFLASLARMALIYDVKSIGTKDWYKWGAESLVVRQAVDGSWVGHYDAADTCFALLFLKRTNVAEDLTAALRLKRADPGPKPAPAIPPAAKKVSPTPKNDLAGLSLSGHDASIKHIAFAPNGKVAVSADVRSTVKVWDLEKGQEIRSHELPSDAVIQNLVFSQKDSVFSVATHPAKDANPKIWSVRRFDASSGTSFGRMESPDTQPPCQSRTIAVSPEGISVNLTFHRVPGAVRLCHLQTQDLGGLKKGNQTAFQADVELAVFSLSPDGRKGVSASGQAQDMLALWDLEAGSLAPFLGGTAKVECLTFSADGKKILSGSADKTFSIWDVATRRILKRFAGHSGAVHAVAFSPDGKHALTGSSDKTVRLWDLQTGKELRRLTGHEGPVFSAAFSPDGMQALSGGSDRTIRLWRLQN